MSVGLHSVAPTISPTTPLSTAGERSKHSWAHQTRNPVSARLYKVLGTNFNDDATREALRTLSELYAPVQPSVVSREVKHDIDDLNDDEAEEDGNTTFNRTSLNQDHIVVEAFPGESASRARKNLRRDMEMKLAEGSWQFLKAFGDVDQKLVELHKHVNSMRRSCDEADEQLRIIGEASKSLLDKAESLRQERREIETKNSVVSLFLARFTLTDDEVEAMTSRGVPVGDALFNAMDKADRIRNDCRVLMTGEDGPTKAGLDIIASTSSQLEQGYEKIFRWCSYDFQQIGRDSLLEVSATMQEAIRRLRKRPEFLSEALSFLSQTRQAALMNSFLAALTRGGPSGLPRPIELHAHDPIRYVGDMLAWVHQAIAAELEFLESLFGLKSDKRMVGSVRIPNESEEEEWIRELMDFTVGKLCVPLKVRVEQTVRSQGSSITLYKIANLLQFYMMTMRRTIGKAALLSTTLQEITDTAYNVFYNAVETQGRALLRIQLDPNDTSVAPPLLVLDHSQILREVMTVYQSSLFDGDNEEEHAIAFQRILNSMVDPVIEMCSTVGVERKGSKQKWDQEIFVLNCLAYLQSVLEPFTFTTRKQQEVQKVIDDRVKTLTEQHCNDLLTAAGIRDAVIACENGKPKEPLSRIPATSTTELQSALHRFSLWLSGNEVVQSPRLAQLTLQRLHTQIHQAALKRLAKAYQRICEEVKKPENRYEAGSTLLGSERPFGQIHLLWQIFGLHGEMEGS